MASIWLVGLNLDLFDYCLVCFVCKEEGGNFLSVFCFVDFFFFQNMVGVLGMRMSGTFWGG